jgi:hypothetical protein
MAGVERRFTDEKIEAEWVLPCRSCGFDAFVVQDEINSCYLCGQQEDVAPCGDCGDLVYSDETEQVYARSDKTWRYPFYICRLCYLRHEETLAEEAHYRRHEDRLAEEAHWDVDQRQLDPEP